MWCVSKTQWSWDVNERKKCPKLLNSTTQWLYQLSWARIKETIFEGFSEPYLRTSRPKEASGSKKVFTTKIAKHIKQCGIIWGKNDPNFCFFIHQSPWLIKTLYSSVFLTQKNVFEPLGTSKYSPWIFFYFTHISRPLWIGKRWGRAPATTMAPFPCSFRKN